MTNEQLAEFIKAGGNDEFIPLLWDRVRKLLYKLADKYYIAYSSSCEKCGVTVWDLKQASYYAYMGALKAYDSNKGYKFTTYLDLQFKSAVRPLFGKDLLNAAQSLNVPAYSDKDSESIELFEVVPDERSLDIVERVEKLSVCAIVHNAVERLPEELKRVIYCRYYEELSLKCTGKCLCISENAVLSLERKAIKLLRKDKTLIDLIS